MKSIPKFRKIYDDSDDTLWILISSGTEAYAEEVAPGVTVEFGENNEVIGIEIQEYKRLIQLNTHSDVARTKVFSFHSPQMSNSDMMLNIIYKSPDTHEAAYAGVIN